MGKVSTLARKARKQKLKAKNKPDLNVLQIVNDMKQHRKGALTIIRYVEKDADINEN